MMSFNSIELSDKIAQEIGILDTPIVENYTQNDMQEMLKVASMCLKASAQKQKNLESQNSELSDKMSKLAEENSRLVSEKEIVKKKELVEVAVTALLRKGMLKRADFESKVKELMELDYKAINMFISSIESLPEKTASEYADNLTFLYNNNNIKDKDTRTMSEVISNIIGG
ncbi:MAG: hypothetical protein ACRCX2_34650 [Paraclostridium sp.]